jgi:hypothetical protein
VLDAELPQLPAGKARALEQGTGFVHDDLAELSLLMQRPDNAKRRSPAQAGEGPRVAMRVDRQRAGADSIGQVTGAALAHAPAHADRRVPDSGGRSLDGCRAAADHDSGRLDFTAQVDSRRPGGGDALDLGLQARRVPALALRLTDRERDTQGARDAEGRGAADSQPDDRVNQFVHRGDVQHAELVWQHRLVDRDDVLVPPGDHVVQRASLPWIALHNTELTRVRTGSSRPPPPRPATGSRPAAAGTSRGRCKRTAG